MSAACCAQDVWKRWLGVREYESLAAVDLKAGLLDSGPGVAGGMAISGRVRPERRVGGMLQRTSDLVVCDDVLVEMQLAAGAQHSVQLRER